MMHSNRSRPSLVSSEERKPVSSWNLLNTGGLFGESSKDLKEIVSSFEFPSGRSSSSSARSQACHNKNKDEFGYREVISVLQKELARCKEELSEANKNESELRAQRSELLHSNRSLRKDCDEMNSDIQLLLQDNSDLEKAYQVSQAQLKALENEHRQALNEKDRIAEKLWEERENTTLNEEADTKIWNLVTKHKIEFQKLVQERTLAEQHLKRCQQEVEESQEAVSRLLSDNKKLLTRNKALETEVEQQTEIIQSLRDVVSKQCTTLSNMKKEETGQHNMEKSSIVDEFKHTISAVHRRSSYTIPSGGLESLFSGANETLGLSNSYSEKGVSLLVKNKNSSNSENVNTMSPECAGSPDATLLGRACSSNCEANSMSDEKPNPRFNDRRRRGSLPSSSYARTEYTYNVPRKKEELHSLRNDEHKTEGRRETWVAQLKGSGISNSERLSLSCKHLAKMAKGA